MGSSKRAKSKSVGPGPAAGNHAKERHKRDRRGHLSDRNRTPPPSLKDLKGELPKPKILSKYRTYFELVENADKKKKLDFEVQQPAALVELRLSVLTTKRNRH